MSAFMVSIVHINVLINAGLLEVEHFPPQWFHPPITEDDMPGDWEEKRHTLNYETAEEIGAMLLAENQASVNCRYEESEIEPVFVFRRIPGHIDPVVVLKAIACYEYQTCEHSGWETSSAKAFCENLRTLMIGRLPGYDAAPWGVDDPDYFVTHAKEARR